MKSRSRHGIARLVRLVRGQRSPRILVHHQVTLVPRDHPDQMTVSTSRLALQMDALIDHGATFVDAAAFARAARSGAELPRNAIALTFDDGFDGLHHALPVLRDRGLRATAFVPSQLIEGARSHPGAWGGYLDRHELRELAETGVFDIGCHGARHHRLRGLDGARLTEETMAAKERLAEALGVPIELFAYPFGAYDSFDRRSREAVKAAGFLGAFTSVFGALRSAADPFLLPRCRVSEAEDAARLSRLVEGAYDWYRIAQRVRTLR